VILLLHISILVAVSHLARAAHTPVGPGYFNNMAYANYFLVRRALVLPRVVHKVKKKKTKDNSQVSQEFLLGVTVNERDSQVASKAN
jgi:hypothetical protein